MSATRDTYDNQMGTLLEAYSGNEPYIFVSYSHKDTKRVYPVIARLISEGYRVWYDSGIDPGTEWDENIAYHIMNCGYFVAFLSENYLASNNCKDELNYARDLEKERLVVYLEQVNLPAGMAMRINRIQSVFKYVYRTQEDFYKKLFTTKNIYTCREKVQIDSQPVNTQQSVQLSPQEPKNTSQETHSQKPEPKAQQPSYQNTQVPKQQKNEGFIDKITNEQKLKDGLRSFGMEVNGLFNTGVSKMKNVVQNVSSSFDNKNKNTVDRRLFIITEQEKQYIRIATNPGNYTQEKVLEANQFLYNKELARARCVLEHPNLFNERDIKKAQSFMEKINQ